MYKKTLLSLAVASSVALTGCFEDAETGKNAGSRAKIQDSEFEGKTYPVFNPVTSELPLPNDLIFDSEAKDGSFNVDIPAGEEDNPVLNALNNLSGASTTAPAVIPFNGEIRESTVKANQSVFLVELDYAGGDPVRGLTNQEPPTPSGLASIQTDVVELDDNSAIRILPEEPLDPLKRYVVVLTKGIQDQDEEPISQSPSYARLSENDSGEIGVDGLNSVQNLINNLWEPSVLGLFDDQDIPVSEEDLALTYSFTTSDDEKVLSYIAAPSTWIADQLERETKVEATKTVTGAARFADGEDLDPDTWDLNDDDQVTVEDFDRNDDGELTSDDFDLNDDGEFDSADTQQAATTAVQGFEPSQFTGNSNCDGESGADKFSCVGEELAGNFSFPEPSSDGRNISLNSPEPASSVSVILQDFAKNNVDIHQGSITLPYYLGTPGEDNAAPISTDAWKVDSDLAGSIAEATGFEIPQADPDQSSVLNYNFPFPGSAEDIEVPLLVMTPDGTDPSSVDEFVIFQHGITTDRSAALAFGSALIDDATDEIAVVAIDQPLHGIAPASTEDRLDLAGDLLEGADPSLNIEEFRTAVVEGDQDTLVNDAKLSEEEAAGLISTNSRAGSTIPGLSPNSEDSGVDEDGVTERHFGYTADSENMPTEMNFDESDALGESGSLFINLTNFPNGRDNLRQGSLDLMNLRAAIGDEWGATDDNTHLVGHSLGATNGGAYVGATNLAEADDLRVESTHLVTPATGLTGLLTNSPSLAPDIYRALRLAGLSAGDADLETFANVNQHALDSADPINFADHLGDRLLISQVDGDRTTPNAAVSDDNALVEAGDVPEGNPVLRYEGLPLERDGTMLTFDIRGEEAPLSGSEQLKRVVGAEAADGSGTPPPVLMRHQDGAHATPVLPKDTELEKEDIYLTDNGNWRTAEKDGDCSEADDQRCVVTESDASTTFSKMISQTLELIGGNDIN